MSVFIVRTNTKLEYDTFTCHLPARFSRFWPHLVDFRATYVKNNPEVEATTSQLTQ